MQAGALLAEARAKVRQADEYDAAVEKGEATGHGGDRSKVPNQNLASPGDVGRKKALFEARQGHDARWE